MRIQNTLSIALAICTMLTASTSMAKVINLYDQPAANAKVVGNVDSDAGMVPIFTPPNSEWMKVGNPSNGNVGWIKTSDLGNNSGSVSTSFSVKEQTIKTSSGPKSIQVVKLSTPSQAQTDAMIKQNAARQAAVEASIHKMMQAVYQQMNAFYDQNPTFLADPNNNTYPVIVPIVVYPSNDPAALAPASPITAPTLKK